MLTRYRAWATRDWARDPFNGLSPMARYLYLLLCLGPQSTSIPGVTLSSRAGLLYESGLDEATFAAMERELESAGVLLSDSKKRLWVLRDAVEAAFPANPNAVVAWCKAFNELPDSEIKAALGTLIEAVLQRCDMERPLKSTTTGLPTDSRGWSRQWRPI